MVSFEETVEIFALRILRKQKPVDIEPHVHIFESLIMVPVFANTYRENPESFFKYLMNAIEYKLKQRNIFWDRLFNYSAFCYKVNNSDLELYRLRIGLYYHKDVLESPST